MIAQHFQQHGWNVAATMRTPEKDTLLHRLTNVKLYRLDVTIPETVDAAVIQAITDFCKIDVLVNNAGYGALGIFEKANEEDMRRQMETNVLGLMRVTKALLPHFRANSSGTIINIGSVAGELAFPYFALYNASKYAVNGFSKALYYELKMQGIAVKLVLPGMMKTDFFGRSMTVFEDNAVKGYEKFEETTRHNIMHMAERGEDPALVMRTVFKAATTNTFRLMYPVGWQARLLLILKYILPHPLLRRIMETAITRRKI